MESPGSLRSTSVAVVTLASGEVYIVVSLLTRRDTQVIYVDPTTGALCYKGKTGFDVFEVESQAINFLTKGSQSQRKDIIHGRAILGYAAFGSVGLLLIATKLSCSIPELPGGGCVYTVTESQWIKIPLQNPQAQGKGEVKNVLELTELDIDGKHYFCETRDITRPFPSRMPLQNPDEEFVWNSWFTTLFKAIGLPQSCVTLLQGFADHQKFGRAGQFEGIVSLVARRSRLHPGTRYLARGLNSCFSTGNEVECEQIVWVPKASGQSVPFNTHVWRRGTIPIWWGADLKLTAAEAEIYVSDRDPYKGSSQYYERLTKRYDARNIDLGAGSNQRKNSFVPIVCVNLLRYGEGKSESILVQHFEESVNFIRSSGTLPCTRIFLVHYDWHASMKLKGEQETIEGLWERLKDLTIPIGISEGDYLPSRQHTKDCKGEVIYNDNCEGAFCLRSHQNGVLRFNCADSLDRTNAASFFSCAQVFVEQCRRLGILLDSDWILSNKSFNNDYIAPLPLGWEKKSNAATGKTYFIDHNTRMTTWTHPCPDKPWKRFEMKFETFKISTILSPVVQLADLFLLAGDIHATLYTGSKAMHSQILGIFGDDTGKYKQYSAAKNLKITLERRYKNAMVDSSRQKQLEMFLGMRLFKHLPSIPVQPLKVFSRPAGFLLKPVPSISSSLDSSENLLTFKKDLIWVCHEAADVIELFIYLAEPCHVCQLLLTVSHGADDLTYPSTVDVRTGRSLDSLKLVLEAATIPTCASGTNILIPLSGAINAEDMAITGAGTRLHTQDSSMLSLLYDYEEVEGEVDFLSRVVALTFYPAVPGQSPMTIGEIEVLGVSLPWKRVFTGESSFIQHKKNTQKEINVSLPSSETNPFSRSLAANNVTPIVPAVAYTRSVDPFLDLLTGGDTFHEPVHEVRSSTTATSDPLDFLDQDIVEHQSIDNSISDFKRSSEHGDQDQQYIKLVKSILVNNLGRKLDFREALELEVERLKLNRSAAERDKSLLSIGMDPAMINPNLLISDESYMRRLWRYANSLAVLGQAALEDKLAAMTGLENFHDNKMDFWNFTGMGNKCVGNPCQVRFETDTSAGAYPIDSSVSTSEPLSTCSQCRRKVCRVCSAGRGALLFASGNSRDSMSNNGGSSHGRQVDVSTDRTTVLDGIVCKKCCDGIVLDALLLDYVRVLISLRKKSRADAAAYIAVKQVLGSSQDHIAKRNQNTDANRDAKLRRLLGKGEESLAEFPSASFLQSVPTASNSAPSLSLLAPLDSGSTNSYWKAPPSSSSVELTLVLGSLSEVSGVLLLLSPCGYSATDAPTVQIWASNKIDKEERSLLGKWDVQSLITSSSEYYGPEKLTVDEPRHIKFAFTNPFPCRIIWLTLRLQRPGSHSVNLERDFNLFSFDENPSALSRRASFGGTNESDPCIHAKRIVVVGKAVQKETKLSRQGSEHIRVKGWLETAPRLSRFKVPVESEKLIDNELVLEQMLSPVSPLVSGFRLDAFTAIKPRVTHSPSSDSVVWDSSALVEDRHISPAVLHLQVSALLEPHNNMVIVGEFRLPEWRAGTAMYFDFPRKVQTRRIVFRLLGDVAAFVDDPAEQDDSGSRVLPIAAGLSLSNRIKLYHYADPYEMGKWAVNLSSI